MACSKQGKFSKVVLEFDDNVPINVRIQQIAPLINGLIDEYETRGGQGADAFSRDLVTRLRKAGLCKQVWFDVEAIGVHPENREGAMLISVDVHDLLHRIVERGWDYDKCNIMACGLPSDDKIKQEWLKEHQRLAADSDGLLAPYNLSILKCFTARGSHTVGSVRCMKYGVTGIHPEECGENGNISKAKIIDKMASMAEPLERGVPVDLIEGDLAVHCPQLMATLARVDNNHYVGREQTTLQICNRVFNLILRNPSKQNDWIIEQGCIGLGSERQKDVKKLIMFVRNWSGGKDGETLQLLEQYEKTLTAKRKLYAQDLEALAAVDPSELETFVPAMVKAMLNSPEDFTDSLKYSTLFPCKGGDLVTLARDGKNRVHAIAANKMMIAARNFLQAYAAVLPRAICTKLLADLEVRCVMHVFQKKSNTRTDFNSVTAIAKAFYDNAKSKWPRLPRWSKLDAIEAKSEQASSATTGLRELRSDGTLTNEELTHRGYGIGAKLVSKLTGMHGYVYTLVAFDEALLNVTLQSKADEDDEDDEDDDPFEVVRLELLKDYSLQTVLAEEVPP